ncbi:phosphotransferase [Rhodanobacter aciditrophus]|uniref:Phosphotransferase n=1 Tax=Rhodanobacter aciditrophus TaxID=1623218 RepID=A0ABW4B410_9GAMM
MEPELFIKGALQGDSVVLQGVLQSLWSGYGQIARYQVKRGSESFSVILKSINWRDIQAHPRGWQSDLSHQRKVTSYKVENHWYQHWSQLCDERDRVAKRLGSWEKEETLYLLLEDLDEAGFSRRMGQLSLEQVTTVLHWLACFHGRFLTLEVSQDWPEGLWPRGTYWHLSTRPNEWQAMADSPSKEAASALDHALASATYQTLVHGDAKVANFCFSEDAQAVAAVDFQYVGRGIGSQDVAYFLGSCLSEQLLAEYLDYLLDVYFSELSRCIVARGESPDLAESVAQEWYRLFPVAWADFHRFILGWSPTHHKNTHFSERLAQKGVDYLRCK